MKVAVKDMKGKEESQKEIERCKREVLHEANVLINLGYHPNRPWDMHKTATILDSPTISWNGK